MCNTTSACLTYRCDTCVTRLVDVWQVLMPVVPLGVTSFCTMHILNHGYDNLEVQYKLPADNVNIPLEVRGFAF